MASSDHDPDTASSAATDDASRQGTSAAGRRKPVRRKPVRRRSRVARVWRALTSPFYRYRNAGIIHGVRVGLAMLVSIFATTGIDIPHGIWASVTLLVVIGGLQHHGNIRKKAAERALGTVLGALIGLTLIVVQAVTGFTWLTYSLMAIVAAVCSYYAIGKAGYVPLLTAITMCIVAGHGDNHIDTGLWRTLNVMIGIVIALAFSFALPLHATYSWRYRLADNLREIARVYAQVVSGAHVDTDAQVETFRRLNGRLVQLRALMPSVAKEIDVPLTRLEQVQRLHRSLLSSLEMMSTGLGNYEQRLVRVAFAGRSACVREALLATARALRFGGTRHPEAAARALRAGALEAASGGMGGQVGSGGGVPGAVPERVPAGLPGVAPLEQGAAPLAPEMQGPYWLEQRFEEQVGQLRALLLETEPRWNIERAHMHRMV
ncbi:FUSC family protein [Paraburkholderia silviterrae]|uniref:FUSC family protein n=1 Tax=Paraburkholderia silviterrae TaxID=2528715 RepID=A0A4R5M4F4_9BURK|nr:FUSC family protein [Paraburkholderia silviterrae]TDG20698.1 FUSC family protein [Paraburkholderia silviterrae]